MLHRLSIFFLLLCLCVLFGFCRLFHFQGPSCLCCGFYLNKSKKSTIDIGYFNNAENLEQAWLASSSPLYLHPLIFSFTLFQAYLVHGVTLQRWIALDLSQVCHPWRTVAGYCVCLMCLWGNISVGLIWGLGREHYLQFFVISKSDKHCNQQGVFLLKKAAARTFFFIVNVYFVCYWCLNWLHTLFMLDQMSWKPGGIYFLLIHIFEWERSLIDEFHYFPDKVHLAFVNSNAKLVKYWGKIMSGILDLVPKTGQGRFLKVAVHSTFVCFGFRNRAIKHNWLKWWMLNLTWGQRSKVTESVSPGCDGLRGRLFCSC